MYMRVVPIIDRLGQRSYVKAPGATYFEAAYTAIDQLSTGERIATDLLELSEQEIQVLDKQAQCHKLREDMRPLIEKKYKLLNLHRSTHTVTDQLNRISTKIFRLEREIRKTGLIGGIGDGQAGREPETSAGAATDV
ncbi:hypothetical protein [Paenibacillus sp. FSL K6-1230]|uniref:hypothetical protein n=1 Tax=Paenibacillus sp. FSL K6-1230 TaxID=2921603 RepID=UPI0030F63765